MLCFSCLTHLGQTVFLQCFFFIFLLFYDYTVNKELQLQQTFRTKKLISHCSNHRIYRLATMHNVTDRQTDRQTVTIPLADHIACTPTRQTILACQDVPNKSATSWQQVAVTTRHNKHNGLLPAPTWYGLVADLLRESYNRETDLMDFGLNRAMLRVIHLLEL